MSNPLEQTSSHFFKVILQSTIKDKKLGIPSKFARKFGDELLAVATLRIPNGFVWQVGLKKDGRKIWFHDGWREFVKHHSICVGYFLVFEYVKNSTFHVLIFDMSACEIDYPSTDEDPENGKQNSTQQDEMKNENSVEIMGATTTNKKPISPLRKKEPQRIKCKMEEPEEMDESNCVKDNDLLSLLEDKGICITERIDLLSSEERDRAIKIAGLFKRKYPSFMVILQSNSHNYRCVYAPAKFASKYVNKSAKFIKLQDSDGRKWPIQIYWRSHGAAGFYLTKGWNEFSEDNNINNQDICVFQLIRVVDVLLKVSVFHATM